MLSTTSSIKRVHLDLINSESDKRIKGQVMAKRGMSDAAGREQIINQTAFQGTYYILFCSLAASQLSTTMVNAVTPSRVESNAQA